MAETKRSLSGRLAASAIFVACGLAVFFVSITFSPLVPDRLEFGMRIAVAALCLLSATVLGRSERLRGYGRFFFALSIAATALLMSWRFSHLGLDLFGLDTGSPRGIATAKLSDSILVVVVIVLAIKLTGGDLGSLYLRRGRLGWGLLVGIVSFSALGIIATLQAVGGGISPRLLVSWTPWILVFVLSNGFMEELLFRGLFLKRVEYLAGARLSILSTAIVFTAAHAQVTYTSDLAVFLAILFVLAIAWGYLMRRTGSILASFLFHAGADLLIIVPIFTSFGVQG